MNPKISTLFKLRIIVVSLILGYVGSALFTLLLNWPQGGPVLAIGYVGERSLVFLPKRNTTTKRNETPISYCVPT